MSLRQCVYVICASQQSSASPMVATPMLAPRQGEKEREDKKTQLYLEVSGSQALFRCHLCPCALVLHTSQQL